MSSLPEAQPRVNAFAAVLGASCLLVLSGCAGPRTTLMTDFTSEPVSLQLLSSSLETTGDRVHATLKVAPPVGGDGALVITMVLDGVCGERQAADVRFWRPIFPGETSAVIHRSLLRLRCGTPTTLEGSIWGETGFRGPELKEPFVVHFHGVPLDEPGRR